MKPDFIISIAALRILPDPCRADACTLHRLTCYRRDALQSLGIAHLALGNDRHIQLNKHICEVNV